MGIIVHRRIGTFIVFVLIGFPRLFPGKTYFSSCREAIILFLDKMVNTILSCAFRAGRQWRREMYGLRFGAAMPLTARPRSHKTGFNRFMKN